MGILKIILATFPICGVVMLIIWEYIIEPTRIPRAEIEALAWKLIEQYGERAAEMAYYEHYSAWRASDGFKQGKWRRVRRYLEKL